MRQPVVFLDRDGVLNRVVLQQGRPHPPAGLAETELLPGVPEALQRLKQAGFKLIVVTNQPDVARGTQTREEVEAIHAFLLRRLPLDAIRSCFHDDAQGCGCRKPLPGLLLQESEQVDYSRSFMIGDRWRDIEAGRSAGCRTIFIDYGYREKQPDAFDHKATCLADAAEWICKQFPGDSNEH